MISSVKHEVIECSSFAVPLEERVFHGMLIDTDIEGVNALQQKYRIKVMGKLYFC